MKASVVITYRPTLEEKKAFYENLGETAQLVFLEEVPKSSRKKHLNNAEVLVSRSFSRKEISSRELDLIRSVKFVQLIFSGADNVPFDKLPSETLVASNKGAFADPVAEHVLALTLALAKRLFVKHIALSKGDFDESGLNRKLKGAICGIIGLGENGKAVASRMRAVGMKIYGINRKGQTGIDVDFIGTPENLKKVLTESDIVVLTVPLTRSTRGMIGTRELKWMKPDAILINVARGDVVDQKALHQHLQRSPKFSVGIDTWWSEPASHGSFHINFPFFKFPNLIGSPHNADHVPGMMLDATQKALRNIHNYLLGKKVHGILPRKDYPPS